MHHFFDGNAMVSRSEYTRLKLDSLIEEQIQIIKSNGLKDPRLIQRVRSALVQQLDEQLNLRRWVHSHVKTMWRDGLVKNGLAVTATYLGLELIERISAPFVTVGLTDSYWGLMLMPLYHHEFITGPLYLKYRQVKRRKMDILLTPGTSAMEKWQNYKLVQELAGSWLKPLLDRTLIVKLDSGEYVHIPVARILDFLPISVARKFISLGKRNRLMREVEKELSLEQIRVIRKSSENLSQYLNLLFLQSKQLDIHRLPETWVSSLAAREKSIFHQGHQLIHSANSMKKGLKNLRKDLLRKYHQGLLTHKQEQLLFKLVREFEYYRLNSIEEKIRGWFFASILDGAINNKLMDSLHKQLANIEVGTLKIERLVERLLSREMGPEPIQEYLEHLQSSRNQPISTCSRLY
ncbi:MAG: hypothetical protein AB8E15_04215 [Bdellovibrionales bacterium]